MVLDRSRPRNQGGNAGRTLYETAVHQARSHALYAEIGAPDTVEGRFELLTLHVIMLVARLRGVDPRAAAARQAVFDAYISDLDGALREMGVGDLTVGKRMKALGAAFYGRADAFDRALQQFPATDPIEALLRRTVFAETDRGDAVALTTYVLRCDRALAECTLDELLEGLAPWPKP